MYVSINEVNTTKKCITIKATDLESIFNFDNLDEDIDLHEVTFVFPFGAENANALKYLYKVMSSQKACNAENTMAGKLNALVGACLYLSENFRK